MDINRLDALIMAKLNKSKAVDEISAMTISEINDGLGRRTHLWRRISFLQENGYVASGLKNWNAATYYITDMGTRYLKNRKETQCNNKSTERNVM